MARTRYIFNFADIYVMSGMAMVIFSPVYFTLRYFKRAAWGPASRGPPAPPSARRLGTVKPSPGLDRIHGIGRIIQDYREGDGPAQYG